MYTYGSNYERVCIVSVSMSLQFSVYECVYASVCLSPSVCCPQTTVTHSPQVSQRPVDLTRQQSDWIQQRFCEFIISPYRLRLHISGERLQLLWIPRRQLVTRDVESLNVLRPHMQPERHEWLHEAAPAPTPIQSAALGMSQHVDNGRLSFYVILDFLFAYINPVILCC